MEIKEVVYPEEVEILLFYPCPRCQRKMPVIAPVEMKLIRCDQCGHTYKIASVRGKDILYLKSVLAGGRSLVAE